MSLWASIAAALRLIATNLGIVHEPSYVVVRTRVHSEAPARDPIDRAA